MMPRTRALALCALLSGPALLSQEPDATVPAPPVVVEPVSFVTEHEGVFGAAGSEEPMRYRATAGELHLRNEEGQPTAAVFSFTYERLPIDRKRPVTFVFNGGPGSASVWLHMGVFGPRRVVVPSEADGDDGAAPFEIVDNPLSVLDLTDLVFIDPVGTGFSRVVGQGEEKDFYGLVEDARSIAQFVRRWITENQRWNAPKYLAGESFGTTRAAAVTAELARGGQNLALNGLILISQALDYTGSTPSPDNLVAHVTYLPTMALTARYHGKGRTDLSVEELAEESRRFATDVLAPALFKGSTLADEERERVAEELAALLGLERDYVLRANLRVTVPRFTKELLRDRGVAVGRLDSRYVADEADDNADSARLGDAASNAISSAYTAALQEVLATELEVTMDRPYLTSGSVGSKWRWRPVPDGTFWEPSYVNTARWLSDGLRTNADLRVLVANGYYDLITPFFDAEYTFARHDILADRVQMTYYEAGHMMYVRQADFVQLVRDVREFLAGE